MPISLDPDRLVPVSLASDAAKPEASRPVFLCRFLSVRERGRVCDLLDAAAAAKGQATIPPLADALALIVRGWRNVDRPFAGDALDVLTLSEGFELVGNALQQTTLTEADLGGSSSAAPSGGDASADSAAPASA